MKSAFAIGLFFWATGVVPYLWLKIGNYQVNHFEFVAIFLLLYISYKETK